MKLIFSETAGSMQSEQYTCMFLSTCSYPPAVAQECMLSTHEFLWHDFEPNEWHIRGEQHTAYRQIGVRTMPRMQGGAAAMNHVSHGDDTATPACAARSRHSRFCAAAVRNRLDEKFDTCSARISSSMPSRHGLQRFQISRAALNSEQVYSLLGQPKW